MAKAQHDCYISGQTKDFGEMSQVIIKGNRLETFKLDNYIVLIWSKKHWTKETIVKRIKKALEEQNEN